jgi:glycine/D-amino acid oxidase-like deaminating enzyme
MKARTVVIGGGVVGISTALHLAGRTDPLTEPVVLLEAGIIGEGSDALSGAVLSQYAERQDLGGMARDSLRYYRTLEERTARSLGILPSGVLRLAGGTSDEERSRLRNAVALLSSLGVRIEEVDAPRMRELFPGLEVAGDEIGTWEPEGGCLDPHRCLEALSTLARDAGAVIRQGTRALEVLVEDGRVIGVRTADGDIRCDSVVVASGTATHALLRPLGIELPLEFLRSDHCYMAGCSDEGQGATRLLALAAGPEASGATGYYPGGFVRTAGAPDMDDHDDEDDGLLAAHPVLVDPGQGFYVRCDPINGRVTVGRRGGDGYPVVADPAAFDDALDREFLGWAREVVEHRLPGYSEVHEIGAGARLVTRTPDREPVLGAFSAVEGLHTACALAGQAFLLAPSVGEGMARLVLGEPNGAFDTARYSPARFGA